MTFKTRFAPSPTGPLHLGHAYSALLAYDMARLSDGEFLLRIEDIDQGRCRPHWETQIYEDLTWLGLDWSTPVMRQSDRADAYTAALKHLSEMGLTYPCSCRRSDIELAAGAPQEGVPQFGPDGRIYPGSCRTRALSDQGANDVIRLNMTKAMAFLPKLSFEETGPSHMGAHMINPQHLIQSVGDIILQRRGMTGSYHLSVVVDDAAQGITRVIRGEDLWEATKIHVILQYLLSLSSPTFHHHALIRDDVGKRLAKRDDARAIRKYRDEGATPVDIRKMVGLSA